MGSKYAAVFKALNHVDVGLRQRPVKAGVKWVSGFRGAPTKIKFIKGSQFNLVTY